MDKRSDVKRQLTHWQSFHGPVGHDETITREDTGSPPPPPSPPVCGPGGTTGAYPSRVEEGQWIPTERWSTKKHFD